MSMQLVVHFDPNFPESFNDFNLWAILFSPKYALIDGINFSELQLTLTSGTEFQEKNDMLIFTNGDNTLIHSRDSILRIREFGTNKVLWTRRS